MSELKATRGKWAPYLAGERPGIDVGGESIVIFGAAGDECGIGGSTMAERAANAHLIAAAPELYEALSSLLEIQPRPPINESEKWQVRKAKAALTKARGEP